MANPTFQPPSSYTGPGGQLSDYSFLSAQGGAPPGAFLTGGMKNQFNDDANLFAANNMQRWMPQGMRFPDGTRGGGMVSSQGQKKHGWFRRWVIPIAAGVVGGMVAGPIGAKVGYSAGNALAGNNSENS